MAYPKTDQFLNLVLNERTQRGDNDGDSCHYQGRELVTQTLSSSGRHQDKTVLPETGSIDGLKLVGSEVLQTERLCEYLHELPRVRVGGASELTGVISSSSGGGGGGD